MNDAASPQDRRRRVLVTGIGLATSLALGREASWTALRQGQARAWPLALAEPHAGPPHHGFPAPYPERFQDGFDPTERLLDDCLREAVADAGLSAPIGSPVMAADRVAVLVGLSKGRMPSLERLHDPLVRDGLAAFSGQRFTACWPHAGASRVAGQLGAGGPCLAPVAACATGLVAAIQGADLIGRGCCDLAVVGAVDASLSLFLLSAFRSMKALARLDAGEDPSQAIRPWDRQRKGFLVGEGGALLVLEDAEHAAARGATAYAELAGGALGGDAYHLTDLNPDPQCLARVIAASIENARVSIHSIDYINVHGTATRSNDPLECRALRRVFGTGASRLSCSANKAQIGHLLGAAGAVELAITCLATRDKFVPPTANLHDPDPECNLDATPLVGQSREITAAIKLSLGFGGHLASAVLKRPQAGEARPPLYP